MIYCGQTENLLGYQPNKSRGEGVTRFFSSIPPIPMRNHIEQSQIDEVILLLSEGVSRKQIVKRVGISTAAIYRIALGHQTEIRLEDRYYNPTQEEIAAACKRIRAKAVVPNPHGENDLALPVFDTLTLEQVA